jgi:hypothetical protein
LPFAVFVAAFCHDQPQHSKKLNSLFFTRWFPLRCGLRGRFGFCLGSFNVGLMSPLVCKVRRLLGFQQITKLFNLYRFWSSKI